MKYFFALFLLIMHTTSIWSQNTPARQATTDSLDALRIQYIATNKDYAMQEMQRSGIPASITLAQGILESAAGTSFLAQTANNHFGMKCGEHWNGSTAYKHDDEYNKQGTPVKSCFRSYASTAQNYADHSEFLRDPQKTNRYGTLFLLDPLDYVAWANGLQAAGYSPVGHYSARIIEFIERYRLHELDHQAWNNPQLRGAGRYFYINETRALFAYEGESIDDIAGKFNILAANIVAWNDYYYKTGTALSSGTPIFLGPKQLTWNGSDLEYYFSHDGKTLFEIGQIFGIQLDALRSMNKLKAGQEPALSAKIRIQGAYKSTDKVALRSGPLPRATQPKPRNKKPPMSPIKYAYEINETNASRLRQVLATQQRRSQQPVVVLQQERTIPAPTETGILDGITYHEVQSGDTLVGIARKYGLALDALKRLNTGVKGDKIQAGQRLRVR